MRMARRVEMAATPICRCRVLYLGSSVPQVTKDGLQGIQEPLRELYPAEGAVGARGIDSWLSVWSNGLLLENVDENQKKMTRFFPIESLHYCAAVRYVVVGGAAGGVSEGSSVPRFLPLDSPFARNPSINHPPLFACIMRRTTGIKVLECHAFICKRETAANALVRCSFHAYADSSYVRCLEGGPAPLPPGTSYGGPKVTEERAIDIEDYSSSTSEIIPASNGSSPTLEGPASPTSADSPGGGADEVSLYNGDENHKVWAGPAKTETELIYSDFSGTLRSARSTASLYGVTGGSSRPARPRQMVMPPIAPPPPSDSDKEGKSKGKGHGLTNGGPPPPPRPNSAMTRPVNGNAPSPTKNPSKSRLTMPHILRGSSSLAERKSKVLPRPHQPFMMVPGPQHKGPHMPMMGPGGGPQLMMPMQGPPQMISPYGPPHFMPPGPMGPYGPPPSGHMGPYGPPMGPPSVIYGHGGRRMPQQVFEEPIYMPSSRPLSPTASYQPSHFPYEQYFMQQHAAGPPSSSRQKHKKNKKKRGQNGVHHEEDDEGMYAGRKGHLNERAFSYSIREEQRSRSYGSLAGLGGGSEAPSISKKDREILQLVSDIDLSGDELGGRQDPRRVYRAPPHADRISASGTFDSRLSHPSRR